MERKTISIFAFDTSSPTICLTYNILVDSDIGITYGDNLQFWIRQDKIEDYDILLVAQKLLRNILLASGNQLKTVKEKEIFIQYQKEFAREKWNAMSVKIDTYNTERLANVMRPYRNFALAKRDFIDKQILKSLIKRGN